MDPQLLELLKWGVTTIVGGVGIVVGRLWVKVDKKTSIDTNNLQKIISLLPFQQMKYIGTYDFGGTINANDHSFLHDFSYQMNNPEFTFLDKDIEGKRSKLVISVNIFLDLLGELTTPVNSARERLIEVPYLDDRREQVGRINKAANDVYSNYIDFFQYAKAKLI